MKKRGGDQLQIKRQDLGESSSSVSETAEQFGHVRGEIGQAVSEAWNQMQVLCQTSMQQYREVVRHIDCASQLGTTKSTMFEDIDNMISQLPPLIKDIEAKPRFRRMLKSLQPLHCKWLEAFFGIILYGCDSAGSTVQRAR